MCLIIRTEKEKPISREVLQHWLKRNNDGWGMMWIAENTIHHHCSMEGIESLYTKYLDLKDYNPVIHLRWKTHGDDSVVNCHPFYCGHGILMMHNGVIQIPITDDPHKSDTRIFVEEVITPIFNHCKNPHEFIRTPEFYRLMQQYIGTDNRLIFGDRGGYVIINPEKWHTISVAETGLAGVLVSNSYAWNENSFRPREPYIPPPSPGLSRKERKRLAKEQQKQAELELVSSSTTSPDSFVTLNGEEWVWNAAKGIWLKKQSPSASVVASQHAGDITFLRNSLGQQMYQVAGNIYENVYHEVWIFNTQKNQFWRAKKLDGQLAQIKETVQRRQKEKEEKQLCQQSPQVSAFLPLSAPSLGDRLRDNTAIIKSLGPPAPVSPMDIASKVIDISSGQASDEELDARDETFNRMQEVTNEEYTDMLVRDWRMQSSAAIHSLVYTDPDAAAAVICRLMQKHV